MSNFVAKAAEKNTILFMNETHLRFYREYLPKCRWQDTYHKALVYCLGLNKDTRNHIDQIYDFRSGCVKTECLTEGWQTSGSKKVVRLAFNLYCNNVPSVNDYDKAEDRLLECRRYSVEDMFDCGYAPWFWQAIRIRYPEYCN